MPRALPHTLCLGGLFPPCRAGSSLLQSGGASPCRVGRVSSLALGTAGSPGLTMVPLAGILWGSAHYPNSPQICTSFMLNSCLCQIWMGLTVWLIVFGGRGSEGGWVRKLRLTYPVSFRNHSCARVGKQQLHRHKEQEKLLCCPAWAASIQAPGQSEPRVDPFL